MRKVIVYEWYRPEDADYKTPFEKKEVGKGVFHQFGMDCTETDNSIGNFSTAIIELKDGTVENIPVELIKFTNPLTSTT